MIENFEKLTFHWNVLVLLSRRLSFVWSNDELSRWHKKALKTVATSEEIETRWFDHHCYGHKQKSCSTSQLTIRCDSMYCIVQILMDLFSNWAGKMNDIQQKWLPSQSMKLSMHSNSLSEERKNDEKSSSFSIQRLDFF